MELNKHIKENYKTQYAFAKKHGLSPQLVSYWCSKPWDRLSYIVRKKILKITNE